jgi:hypothetical protein
VDFTQESGGVVMELLKLYSVSGGSKSFKTIKRWFKAIQDATDARAEFIEREFPSWKKTRTWGHRTYRFTGMTSRVWGVRPPCDSSGVFFMMPPEWRPMRWNFAYRPTDRTRRARELRAEMEDPKFIAPSNRNLGEWLGIGESAVWIEIVPLNSRRFVIALHAKATPPADCIRISDIEFEKLMARKRKAAA